MAVKNSLSTTKVTTSDKISFIANNEEVKISLDDIKNTLTNGNGQITNKEAMMFLSLCKYQHLNPFLKEAYLIKYGDSPATMVVGKDVLLKRAMRSERFAGLQAGVIIINADGKIEEREGTFVIDGEKLLGGWAKVIINGYAAPVYASVSLKEYYTGKSNWSAKPATMIRKVALAQALREAFPEETSALYDASEMDKTVMETTKHEIVLDETPVEMPSESSVEATEPVQVIEPAPAPKNAVTSAGVLRVETRRMFAGSANDFASMDMICRCRFGSSSGVRISTITLMNTFIFREMTCVFTSLPP